MYYLLDTHAWVWWLTDSKSLSRKARLLITDQLADRSVYLASISVWEISQLARSGRFTVSTDLWEWLQIGISIPGLSLVPLSAEIAYQSTALPGEFHKDPADRIIVATARSLQATIISKDSLINKYKGVRSVW